ncbi:hypothetical protein Tco_0913411 [Tanacetum coccineum]
MHERPAGKIRLYTRFFDYANFRLPLSVFLVDVLRHFRINISQLSVIGAAKNGWISFSKCSDNAATCYTKPLDSLKNWNNHFFWVDDFACHASFPWHTAKNVTRDPTPVAADFNAQDYATLVAHPSPFWKFPEAFMCLVGLSHYYPLDEETYPRFLHKNGEEMDLFAFIHTPDPTKVKVVERERVEDEPSLLQTTVGRTVPLLPVAPDRAESELKASVDKLFEEGGSGNQTKQGDSAGGGGQGVNIQLVIEVADAAVEDVAPAQPKRQRKRKTMDADAGGSSHPPKKLREDHETPSGPSVAGKSRSSVQRLLAGAVLNAEVRGKPIPTLPVVTSSVSATPEREGGDHTNSVIGLNLRTVGSSQRFVISSDASHHSGNNVVEAEVDSLIRSSVPVITIVTTVTPTVYSAVVAKEKPVEPLLFVVVSSSAGGTNPTPGGFSDRTGSDFLVGGIHTVIDPDANLQKTYVPQWSVTNGSCLDDGRVSARQMSLSAEVRMRAEYNIKEKRRLKSVVDEQAELLKVREREIESLKAQLLLKEAKAAEAIRLRAEASKFESVEKSLQDEMKALKERNTTLEREKNDLGVKVTGLAASVAIREREVADLDTLVTSIKVHELEVSSSGLQEKVSVYENCMGQLEKFQDDRMKEVNDKFDKLYADFIEMALQLEERFYPYILTTIFGRRWLLTHGMKFAISKCLNSPEYLSSLGAAIGKAIERGMQDGLSAGITHGMEGRALTDVVAYNPSAEAGYISALQRLQNVNFSLRAELRSNKDASIDTLMNILRLEETLAKRLGLTESQPYVDQLMVPIHHSPDKVFVGATALSLALDVSNIRVRKIRENIANQRSSLRDIFVPLYRPFSAEVLTGMEGTSDTVTATTDTSMALSTTLASASTIAPISV